MTTTDEALENAHRRFFGRLVGWLFRASGDLQLAEDAVAAAFASAVTAWRAKGPPDSAEAWLRTASRNAMISALRVQARTVSRDPVAFVALEQPVPDASGVDDRLGLLFACAHPALDPRMHTPLMLQAVLGVDAARIASVYLVPAATMGQRLSRAKAKIRDAGIRYRMPGLEEFPGRLAAVLHGIYGAYGLADPVAAVSDDRDTVLRAEALMLAELVTDLLPGQAEAWGLRALLLHTESRRPARFVGGRFVPLEQQDTALWSADARTTADDCLRRAAALRETGRFQLEAAISAVHSSRTDGRATDWESIVVLYRGLLQLAPSIGATVGAAGALIEIGRPGEAGRLLDSVPAASVRAYQPYWVCRARWEERRGDVEAARAALSAAVGLTENPAVRAYLRSRGE